MFKNVLLLIFVLFVLPLSSLAKNRYSDEFSKIEKSLFNMTYDNQKDEDRLNRIEKNIYGATSNATIEVRMNKLSKDISANLIGQEIIPKKDSFLTDDEIITEKPAENMDFSVVNNLEKKVFQYEFKTLDISNRLSALENQVLKKCYLQDDLSTRIKRLQGVVFYNKLPTEENKIVPTPNFKRESLIVQNNSEKEIISGVNISKEKKMSSSENIKLATLEKALFKTSYNNEKNSIRLARLETKIFNSDFSDDDNETRLNRIESAKIAQISIKKYNSNKSSQHIATFMELGTLILIFIPLLL